MTSDPLYRVSISLSLFLAQMLLLEGYAWGLGARGRRIIHWLTDWKYVSMYVHRTRPRAKIKNHDEFHGIVEGQKVRYEGRKAGRQADYSLKAWRMNSWWRVISYFIFLMATSLPIIYVFCVVTMVVMPHCFHAWEERADVLAS